MDRNTIAIVEDNDGVRDALTLLLRSEGWTVDAYASGEAFLSAVTDNVAPSCVLLDLILSGMNGVEVVTRFARARVPAVALTAYPNSALVEQARAAGVKTILVKPVEADQLIAALRAAIDNC